MGEFNKVDREKIRYIFDIGWDCRLTPCCIEWLGKILKKQSWQITPLLFINEIVEEKERDGDRTVYDCGYWETPQSIGFKNRYIKKGFHANLHQAIHCLNEKRGVSFSEIKIEERFYGGNIVDVLGKTDSEKYIVVELGTLSKPYSKFILVSDPHVKEFWFDGKGKYFYTLKANCKLPIEDSFEHTMLNFPKTQCDEHVCLMHSLPFYEACNYMRKNFLK